MKKAMVGILFVMILSFIVQPVAATAALGDFLFKWGSGGAGDGQFRFPYGIAMDSSNNVFVADTANHRIQVFDSKGNFVRKWGEDCSPNRCYPNVFNSPIGIAVGGNGNVYIVDSSHHKVQVFDDTGTFIGKLNSQFYYPQRIALDGNGKIYVTDTSNNRIQVFDNTGAFVEMWTGFGSPTGIAIDENGYIYVTESVNHRVLVLDDTGTILRSWGNFGFEDGQFYWPQDIKIGPNGYVYVVDYWNNRIQVFSNAGAFITKWGNVGSENGQLYHPMGIAVDREGHIYIADTGNNRIQVFIGSVGCDDVPQFEINSFGPESIWPPSRKIHEIKIAGKVTLPSECSQLVNARFKLVDEYGTYSSEGALMLDVKGNFTLSLPVEGWRDGGDIDGRHYNIVLSAGNEAGIGGKTLGVIVPHDQRK